MQTPNYNRLALRHGLPSASILTMPPALTALLAQLIALLAVGLVVAVAPAPAPALVHGSLPEHLQWALLQGVIAAAISHRLGMARWWLPINLLFIPATVTVLSIDLSPLWFLGAFLLLVLVYGKTYQTQVPLYLSSRTAVKAVASLLPGQRSFSFIDLGSGCGGLLQQLKKMRPDGDYHGIEAAPLPFLLSKCRSILGAAGWHTSWGDFWSLDLANYDVVYAYLSPVPMAALWYKVRKEMRPGSILISNSFVIPGVAPALSFKLDDFSGSTLYLWRL